MLRRPDLASLSAVTAVLDLANGLEQDKSVIAALFALELCAVSGASTDDQRAAFFAALLRHLGCTAFAAVEAEIAGDDAALRNALTRRDTARPLEVLSAVAEASTSPLRAALGIAWSALRAADLRERWSREACGSARALAEQLGFGPEVVRALDEVFERWDGRGAPKGLGGTDVSLPARAANVAHVAVISLIEGGAAQAIEMLGVRAGSALDPGLAALATRQVAAFVDRAPDAMAARLARAEGVLTEVSFAIDPNALAAAFGDFADLATPFTLGHSRRVVGTVDQAAVQMGFGASERESLRWAAHLHDIGQVATPTSLWLLPRAWTERERERAKGHAAVVERVLGSAPVFARAATIAAKHHERLDGSGYPRALAAGGIERASRLLAAADVAVALGEARPHRAALKPPRIRDTLASLARSGSLDPDCVDAVLAASGQPRVPSLAGPVRDLTSREVDVLRGIATGRTNKEIAALLGISARTVQHHTINVYRKLGVDTRAGAALVAVRHGVA